MENYRLVTKSRFQRAKYKVVFNKLIYLVNECTQFLDEPYARYVKSKAVDLKLELALLFQRGLMLSDDADLRYSHYQLKSKFYDHAPMGFLILNSSAGIIDYNNKARELWGLAEGSLKGASFFSLLDARHGIRFNQILREVRLSNEERNFECFCRKIDGKSFFARFHISVADASDLQSGIFLVSVLDITRDLTTERIIRSIAKQASTETESEYIKHLGRLLASIEETRLVVIAIKNGQSNQDFQVYYIESGRRSSLLSLTYRSSWCFDELQEHIGSGLPKSIQQQLLDYICPNLRPDLQFGLNSYILSETNDEVLGHVTLFFQERPKEYEHYQDLLNLVAHRVAQEMIRYVNIEDQKKLNIKLESMVAQRTQDLKEKANRLEREIEARNAIEDKLIQAKRKAELSNRAKSQFLANMSHEIRTPLNGILGITSILKKTSSKKKRDEYVRIVNQSGKVLLRIIDDILDLTRLEAGHLQMISAEFNLRQTLLDIYHSHESESKKRNLEFLIKFPFNHCSQIIGDEIRIRQVIDNLVSNAIKFTDRGKVRVEVKLRQSKDEGKAILKVSVIDTGPGLTAAQKAIIWRRFERLDHSTTRKTDGFGLGLSVTDKLLKLMKGRSSLESEPGKGSRFDLIIPVRIPPRTQEKKKRIASIQALFKNDSLRADCLPLLRSLNPRIECQSRFFEKSVRGLDGLIMDCEAAESLSTREQRLLRQLVKNQNFRVFVINNRTGSAKLSSLFRQHHLDWLLRGVYEGLHKTPKPVHAVPKEPSVPYADVHVLLAEDNEINQRVSADMLKVLGIDVEIAANGLEAVKKVRSGSCFDLILMDCFMPEMDGVEAMKLIKSEFGTNIKVIAVTANAIKGERERYLEQGFDDYMPKPFQFADLQQLMAKYLLH